MVELGESSVVAVVSAPHRAEAFDASRWAIDVRKASAPIWKREQWELTGRWDCVRLGNRGTRPR